MTSTIRTSSDMHDVLQPLRNHAKQIKVNDSKVEIRENVNRVAALFDVVYEDGSAPKFGDVISIAVTLGCYVASAPSVAAPIAAEAMKKRCMGPVPEGCKEKNHFAANVLAKFSMILEYREFTQRPREEIIETMTTLCEIFYIPTIHHLIVEKKLQLVNVDPRYILFRNLKQNQDALGAPLAMLVKKVLDAQDATAEDKEEVADVEQPEEKEEEKPADENEGNQAEDENLGKQEENKEEPEKKSTRNLDFVELVVLKLFCNFQVRTFDTHNFKRSVKRILADSPDVLASIGLEAAKRKRDEEDTAAPAPPNFADAVLPEVKALADTWPVELTEDACKLILEETRTKAIPLIANSGASSTQRAMSCHQAILPVVFRVAAWCKVRCNTHPLAMEALLVANAAALTISHTSGGAWRTSFFSEVLISVFEAFGFIALCDARKGTPQFKEALLKFVPLHATQIVDFVQNQGFVTSMKMGDDTTGIIRKITDKIPLALDQIINPLDDGIILDAETLDKAKDLLELRGALVDIGEKLARHEHRDGGRGQDNQGDRSNNDMRQGDRRGGNNNGHHGGRGQQQRRHHGGGGRR